MFLILNWRVVATIIAANYPNNHINGNLSLKRKSLISGGTYGESDLRRKIIKDAVIADWAHQSISVKANHIYYINLFYFR